MRPVKREVTMLYLYFFFNKVQISTDTAFAKRIFDAVIRICENPAITSAFFNLSCGKNTTIPADTNFQKNVVPLLTFAAYSPGSYGLVNYLVHEICTRESIMPTHHEFWYDEYTKETLIAPSLIRRYIYYYFQKYNIKDCNDFTYELKKAIFAMCLYPNIKSESFKFDFEHSEMYCVYEDSHLQPSIHIVSALPLKTFGYTQDVHGVLNFLVYEITSSATKKLDMLDWQKLNDEVSKLREERKHMRPLICGS